MDRHETEFWLTEKLQNFGLDVDYIIANGKPQRCRIIGKGRELDGSYIARVEPRFSFLWWKDWTTGKTGQWISKDMQDLDRGEKRDFTDCVRVARIEERQEAVRRQKEAAEKAAKYLQIFSLAPEENAYLKRKRVLPFGEVRQATDGKLVVPVRTSEGILTSLQFIDSDGSKRFLSGGLVKGCFYSLPSKKGDKSEPLLVAEGYATAASLHMATGYETITAFFADNLCPVANAARKKHPERTIIMCADNDVHEDDKENVGVRAATKAAQAIGAKLVICPTINGKKADFNDLHTATEEGLERVKACVENAQIVELAESENTFFPEGYFVRETGPNAGLFKRIMKGNEEFELRLGPPIKVVGRSCDDQSSRWGIHLQWNDHAGVQHCEWLSDESLQKSSNEWSPKLADKGYSIAPGMQKHFLDFLANYKTDHIITNTNKVGWNRDRFVLPDETIGTEGGSVVYQSSTNVGNVYQTSGTFEGWQEMARLCSGNDRLIFALCAAFAGPLLKLVGLEGGGFSFEGPSSCGKTTSLQAAASV